jgi:hypothetical protein
MNFFSGIIVGIIISTVGLVNIAKWVDRTAESFKHDVVQEATK